MTNENAVSDPAMYKPNGFSKRELLREIDRILTDDQHGTVTLESVDKVQSYITEVADQLWFVGLSFHLTLAERKGMKP